MAEWTKLSSDSTSPSQGNESCDTDSSRLISSTDSNELNPPNLKRPQLTRQMSFGSRDSSSYKQCSLGNEKSYSSGIARSLSRKNDDLVNILGSQENLTKIDYEIVDFEKLENERNLDEPIKIIKCNNDGILEPELTKSPLRRPTSLYGSQKLKNIFKDKELLYENAINDEYTNLRSGNTEKKPNGKVNSHEKQVHRVQFNHNSQCCEKQKYHLEQTKDSVSISASTSSSSDDSSSIGPFSEARPPDGGWGWVIVAAAFMVNLIADGITFSFGVIYVEFLEYFGEGKGKTSWIGSLFMSMPLLSGPIASFLTDRYGCRKVTIAGSILATSGFVISSFADSMEVLILTFGILAGFGLSLCFVAAVVIVAYYFDKKRSFATGLSVCGSGIGTFIFPPITQYLLEEYGWRGTTLILAGMFLNLAVCGCLMRDLEWTTIKAKEKHAERKKKRENKRAALLQQNSSGDTFSGSSSVNTATQTTQDQKNHNNDCPRLENERSNKLYSSLVNLPTYVKNGEKVPLEVLELLSARKNVYNVLMQNYPNLMISSRSFSDSSGLHECLNAAPNSKFVPVPSPLADFTSPDSRSSKDQKRDYSKNRGCNGLQNDQNSWIIRKTSPDSQIRRASAYETRRVPTAYLKDIRIHRHSLTYRGAMLNINRYRLRASSCPDIYRNSMTTIAKTKMVWYSGLWEFWDLLVDMLDFSHFLDSRFLLFAISNFLLHTWYDVPYFYLTDNALEMGFNKEQSSILISVIGIMNMCGEILLGWAGDRAWVNPSMIYGLSMVLCGAVTSLIPVVIREYYLICVVAGAFGLFIAANYSLTSIILVETISLDRFANAYGLLLLVQGVANLMGPPIAGWLHDITGTYDLSFYLAGSIISLSGAMLMVIPLMEFCRRCNWKWSKKAKEANFPGINSV